MGLFDWLGTSKSNSTTNQTSQLTPWDQTGGALQSLVSQLGSINPQMTGTETSALNALSANAAQGNPYAGAIGGVANSLLSGGPDRTGMVNDAYSQFQKYLTPYANGDYMNPSTNPELQSYLSKIGDDVTSRVNGMFAGAGRDFSGANQNAVARGVGSATAPILYDAYNQAQSQKLGAINSLFQGAGQTAGMLSGMDQTKFGNQQAGIGVAQSAQQAEMAPYQRQLQIEAMRRGIPQDNINSLLSSLAPLAAQFGKQSGTSVTNAKQTASPLQQLMGINSMFAPGASGGGGGGSSSGGGKGGATEAMKLMFG